MTPREVANLRDAIGDGMRSTTFRREWRLYELRNRMAREEYATTIRTLARRAERTAA